MLSRYIKITPLMKYTTPVDLEVSGFKLFSGDNQVDISAATVKINFNPVAGNAGMILRSVITEGEALVIPAEKTRGRGAIYIDLGDNKSFDAFQIGFGSTQAKSMTKLKVEYSDDGVTYRRLADVTYNVRLKYRNPWTFSGLTTNARTGFPALLQKSLLHQYTNKDRNVGNREQIPRTCQPYISDDGLRIATRYHSEDFYNGNGYYGVPFILPISSHLRDGKYYFEVSSESGTQESGLTYGVRHASLYMGIHMETKNSGQTGGSWGDWITPPPAGSAWPSECAYYSMTTLYNGKRAQNETYWGTPQVTGGPVPPDYMAYPGGKKGFQCGVAIDASTGATRIVNSPFTPDFQFDDSKYKEVWNGATKDDDFRLYFTLLSPGKIDGTNLDLSFNFGDRPFQGPVPDGFTDRIGQRWELEIDPNAPTSNPDFKREYEDEALEVGRFVDRVPIDDPRNDFINQRQIRNITIHPILTYYVKGKVGDIEGKFPRRTVEIYTFPQMELMGSCSSSTVDGTYEFLNLSYRDYVVVSSDGFNHKYESVLLGPLKPIPMDPTK